MREPKWLTIITAICTVVSFFIILCFQNTNFQLIYDLALAVFGSALLGFIMSLIQYSASRRTAMESFWDKAGNVLSQLRKIKYLDIDAPFELVKNCFQEERKNNFAELIDSGIEENAKNAFISWYEETSPMPWNENDDIETELNEVYRTQMEVYRKKIIKCIDSYIDAAGIDLGTLNNTYGNLDFIFANNSIRQKAYTNVYQSIRDCYDILLAERYHFSLLKSNEGNFVVCADKAHEICRNFFEEQMTERNGCLTRSIFQKRFDDIDQALEDFRCRIHRKQKPDYPERIPVLATPQLKDYEDTKNKSEKASCCTSICPECLHLKCWRSTFFTKSRP